MTNTPLNESTERESSNTQSTALGNREAKEDEEETKKGRENKATKDYKRLQQWTKDIQQILVFLCHPRYPPMV